MNHGSSVSGWGPAGHPGTMSAMRVAVIDVGSNTARLLVADVNASVTTVGADKVYLGLGAEIVRHGTLPDHKVNEGAAAARRFARAARRLGAERVETIVTAPGRQADDASGLVIALERATKSPVRVLSAEEEGKLAFLGAVALAPRPLPDVVAVCDVGGGSTEVAVGTPRLGPAWVRSAEVGSLRVTSEWLPSDPPRRHEVAAARAAVRRALAPLVPPRPTAALAVGGSARAAAKLVGRTLGPSDLEHASTLAAHRPAAKTAKVFGLDTARAETLVAGTLVLAEASRLLGVPFRLARGGLREGAALTLAGREHTEAEAA
jgi:exopolyphosphatase/guanosine-5'-triphosphate,3'-diphosphate pyrophosphatase